MCIASALMLATDPACPPAVRALPCSYHLGLTGAALALMLSSGTTALLMVLFTAWRDARMAAAGACMRCCTMQPICCCCCCCVMHLLAASLLRCIHARSVAPAAPLLQATPSARGSDPALLSLLVGARCACLLAAGSAAQLMQL